VHADSLFRFFVITPFGDHLEARKHGLPVILQAFGDIAKSLKFALSINILHHDVSYSNIILFENHGYLIDWQVASTCPIVQRGLTGTLLFSSIKVHDHIGILYLCLTCCASED